MRRAVPRAVRLRSHVPLPRSAIFKRTRGLAAAQQQCQSAHTKKARIGGLAAVQASIHTPALSSSSAAPPPSNSLMRLLTWPPPLPVVTPHSRWLSTCSMCSESSRTWSRAVGTPRGHCAQARVFMCPLVRAHHVSACMIVMHIKVQA